MSTIKSSSVKATAAKPVAKVVAEEVKKTEEVKAPVKPVAAKPVAKPATTKAATPKAAAKPTTTKAVAKSATTKAVAKPTTTKAVAKPATKTVAKKTTAKKTIKKAADVKVAIQFADKNYTMEDLTNSAKDVWVYDFGKDLADLKDIALYVKPEESKVYYVFNDNVTGEFNI